MAYAQSQTARLLSFIVMLVAAIATVLSASEPTTRSLAPTTRSSPLKHYTANERGFSFDYPEDWQLQVSPPPAEVIVTKRESRGPVASWTYIYADEAKAMSLKELVEAKAAELTAAFANLKLTEKRITRLSNGKQVGSLAGTIEKRSGAYVMQYVIVPLRGPHSLTVVEAAPAAQWEIQKAQLRGITESISFDK